MARHFAANLVNLLIVMLVIAGGVILWGQNEFTKTGPLTEAIFIEVPRGGKIRAMSEDMAAQGAIRNPLVMRLGAKYSDKALALKFGNYEIPAGASMVDILDIVTKSGRGTFRFVANYRVKVGTAELVLLERDPVTGENSTVVSFVAGERLPIEYQVLVDAKTPINYRIAIAEGVTSWRIVESLKLADFLGSEDVEIPDEGSLAPDTYEVRRGTLPSEVLELMATAQTRILAEEWEARDEAVPLKSAHEALTLASIIEKETGLRSEREEVASVFVNRLNKGLKLQTDPTVIYGLTEGKEPLGRGLRQSELSKKTDYNTYLIKGLPPGPIANPGRAAIRAALHPNTTNFLFFVADGSGGHAFAESLAEHNRNVAKWRKVEAERKQAEEQGNN